MSEKFRCTQCGSTNEYAFNVHEKRQGLNKRKTTKVPCDSCGSRTVQNRRGM